MEHTSIVSIPEFRLRYLPFSACQLSPYSNVQTKAERIPYGSSEESWTVLQNNRARLLGEKNQIRTSSIILQRWLALTVLHDHEKSRFFSYASRNGPRDASPYPSALEISQSCHYSPSLISIYGFDTAT